jgi:hypothetical protein
MCLARAASASSSSASNITPSLRSRRRSEPDLGEQQIGARTQQLEQLGGVGELLRVEPRALELEPHERVREPLATAEHPRVLAAVLRGLGRCVGEEQT